MSQTIKKSVGEGWGKGELYAALAYDATDRFGGMKIKALMLNSTGRISFLDANAYIYSSVTTQLDLVATTIAFSGAMTANGALAFTSAGINIEGTIALALGIGSTTPLTTSTSATRGVLVQSNYAKTDGYHFGAQVISQYTADGASSGSLRAIVGQVDLEGTQTTVNTAQQLVGVHGRAKVSGTAYNSQLNICGVMAQLLDGGTWTAANLVYCLWVDNQLTTNPTAGKVAMIGIRQNNGVGTDVVDHVFDIYGAEIKQLFNFDSCISGGFIATSATAGTMTHTVKCFVDGASGYIHLYDQ